VYKISILIVVVLLTYELIRAFHVKELPNALHSWSYNTFFTLTTFSRAATASESFSAADAQCLPQKAQDKDDIDFLNSSSGGAGGI
jgi:hypothetical protein